eukprot:TRINITY_DN2183_c0_g1_i5.p1 TRINITY_DN2183_c0_g1~~TRINITY_DN2183_c0_g1_i5.p1  ORF type:complete len:211 (-),score=63.04 TRINITY_DN2183_c0_g1_i5:28-660(-)
MELMVEELPTNPQAIFSTALFNEKLAQLYLRNDGSIGILEGQGDNQTLKLKAKKWHVLSFSVDVPAAAVAVYLDGKLSTKITHKEIGVKDGRFAVNGQICIFGSKEVAESLGGNLRSLFFQNEVLSADEVESLNENIQLLRSWQCLTCTCRNPIDAYTCTACSMPREDVGWICPNCTFKNTPGGLCEMCGFQNPELSLTSSLGLGGSFGN